MDRKKFIQLASASVFLASTGIDSVFNHSTMADSNSINTTTGPIPSDQLGLTLVHEHILSRFGPPAQEPGQYDTKQVIKDVVPYLKYIKSLGCDTIVDCTAAYFGRNAALLKKISQLTGINIVTNTGIYGAAGDDYVPEYVYKESAEQLATRWVDEFKNGIQGTDVRPGFVKIGVDPGPLSDIDAKLVRTAALTHLETGLLLQIHTSDNPQAVEQQLNILKEEGVSPTAWVWVHAQNVDSADPLLKVAQKGAWISLDGLRTPNYLNGFGDGSSTVRHHLKLVKAFKKAGMLDRILLSHDGSIYPPKGISKRPLDVLFNTFIPVLKASGFSKDKIDQLTRENPGKAFSINVRTL